VHACSYRKNNLKSVLLLKFGDWITSYLANCLLGIISTLKTGREEWKTMHLSS